MIPSSRVMVRRELICRCVECVSTNSRLTRQGVLLTNDVIDIVAGASLIRDVIAGAPGDRLSHLFHHALSGRQLLLFDLTDYK